MSERLPIVTLECKRCGYTDKRRRDVPGTGHVFDSGWTYTCPDCNSDLRVVEAVLDEDVKTNDPITISKMINNANKVSYDDDRDIRRFADLQDTEGIADKPLHRKGDKVSVTFGKFAAMLKKYEDHMEINDKVDFAIGQHVSNARWELLGAILLLERKWGEEI